MGLQRFMATEVRHGSVLWSTRSKQRYASVAELEAMYAEFFRLVRSLPAKDYVHVADLRASPPGNNSDEFEAVHQKSRLELAERFSLIVLIVSTAAGVMQLTRMQRQGEGDFHIVDSPAQALRLCREKLGPRFLDEPTATGAR